MATEPAPTPLAPLPEGRFTSREAFVQTLRDAVAHAAKEGWRELVLSDASFEDWPLGERLVVECLHAWAGTGRRMLLLACDYRALRLAHPRFVTWRQTWDHILECRQCPGMDENDLPSAVWSPGWMLQRLDWQHGTFICTQDAARRLALRQQLDECVLRSSPGFPASTLGL